MISVIEFFPGPSSTTFSFLFTSRVLWYGVAVDCAVDTIDSTNSSILFTENDTREKRATSERRWEICFCCCCWYIHCSSAIRWACWGPSLTMSHTNFGHSRFDEGKMHVFDTPKTSRGNFIFSSVYQFVRHTKDGREREKSARDWGKWAKKKLLIIQKWGACVCGWKRWRWLGAVTRQTFEWNNNSSEWNFLRKGGCAVVELVFFSIPI